jgi:hypothetical protein
MICRPQTIRVHFSNSNGHQYFYQTADQDGFDAVVAWFRNDPLPDGRGIMVGHVRVNIIYHDGSGNEIGTGIARASWLGENADMMDFHVGETQGALLVVRDSEGKLSNLGKERRRGGFYGDTIEGVLYPLNETLRTIELRVLSGSDLLIDPIRLSFSLDNGVPKATLT